MVFKKKFSSSSFSAGQFSWLMYLYGTFFWYIQLYKLYCKLELLLLYLIDAYLSYLLLLYLIDEKFVKLYLGGGNNFQFKQLSKACNFFSRVINGTIHYNFTNLDNFMHLLWENKLRPGKYKTSQFLALFYNV